MLTQGADQGYLCGAVPLTSAGNCRVKLAGTCEAGDLLVAKGDGRVEAGVIGGEAPPIGMAEESVDGQDVAAMTARRGCKGRERGRRSAGGGRRAGPAGVAGADGAPGTEFLLDPACVMNAHAVQVGALIGLEGSSWNGAVPGMGAELSALVTGTRTVGGTTFFVCAAVRDRRGIAPVFSQVPVSMIGTPVDPLGRRPGKRHRTTDRFGPLRPGHRLRRVNFQFQPAEVRGHRQRRRHAPRLLPIRKEGKKHEPLE